MSEMVNLYELPFYSGICTIKDVCQTTFVKKYAKHLKNTGKMPIPKWADYVKTGISKELAPTDPDWFYLRSAGVLRHLAIRRDMGVGLFKKIYGSKKRRGTRPAHFREAGGKIIRYILQQFEKMGFVTQEPERGGRRLTREGQREVDLIARQCGTN